MSLVDELKRRNVFKVSAAYLALGWIVTQVTGAVVPALNLPAVISSIVVWIGLAGFPFVVMFAWIFELTPEGLKRESEVDRTQSVTHLTGRRLDHIIIGMLGLAMLMLAADRFIPRGSDSGTVVGAGDARDSETSVGAGHARDSNADSQADRAQGALPQQTPVAAPDEKSIAVLPFADMSQAKDQEYFSDGISEELLNLLAKVPELKVIARTSSFAFKGKDVNIAEIARTLNVAHVLEGSVRKSGNTIRITAQLVRASDSTHLWSETWDRPLDNIFAVQDEIAGAVVRQLKITLLGAAPKSRATDPEAYALYLRARALHEQNTPEGYQEASRLLEQVLAIDPGYVEAWRKLASIRVNEAFNGLRTPEEASRLMREYMSKALAIDPEFARGHDGRAVIALNFDLDLAAAARHWQRALALDPHNLDTISNAVTLLQALGRREQAVAVAEFVVARDPASALSHNTLVYQYLIAGRLDDAIAEARIVLSLSPGLLGQYLGMALLLKGDPQAALDAVNAEPSEYWRLIGLAMAQHSLGHAAESEAALQQLIATYERSGAYYIASVYAWRGENDHAFAWLDKARAYQDPNLSSLSTDPAVARIHADPRWPALLRAYGLAPEQVAAISFEVKLPE